VSTCTLQKHRPRSSSMWMTTWRSLAWEWKSPMSCSTTPLSRRSRPGAVYRSEDHTRRIPHSFRLWLKLSQNQET
jgi:hypothetical protein